MRGQQTLHPYSVVLGGATREEWETAPDSQVICSLPNLLQEIIKKNFTLSFSKIVFWHLTGGKMSSGFMTRYPGGIASLALALPEFSLPPAYSLQPLCLRFLQGRRSHL